MALVCAVSACGSRDRALENPVDVVSVASLGDDLCYVQSDGVVQRLNVLSANPQPTTVKVRTTASPRLVVKRPKTTDDAIDELLIVSDGKTDRFGQFLELPTLTALSADGGKRVYPLKDPGQQMRISDDGRFAILFYDPNYVSGNALLSNPGEVAIVDLSAQSADGQNPTIRSIDTVGGPPNSVAFPSLKVGDVPSRFAFFTFLDGASLIDLANPSERGRKFTLTGWAGSGAISPAAGFAIAADPAGNEMFLKTGSSKFVEVVTVMPRTTDDAGLGVSLKQLTVGNTVPGAISVFGNDDGTQLFAVLGSEVALVDTEEDSVTAAPLSHLATQIYMFEGASPEDPNVSQRALVYATGQTRGTFVDLESLPSERERALTAVEFGEPISSIQAIDFLPGRLLVMLAGGGVDILDLTTRHWVPIDSPIALTLVVGDAEGRRVWVSAPGDRRIAYLNFGADAERATLTKSVQLDDPVDTFFRLGTAGNSRVVVTHAQAGGAVTLLDAVNPERVSAKKLEGFLYSDLL
jgi:hypothetical protein